MSHPLTLRACACALTAPAIDSRHTCAQSETVKPAAFPGVAREGAERGVAWPARSVVVLEVES